MLVILVGSVIDVIAEQPKKAEFPIFFTVLGIVTDVRLELYHSAPSPIQVTESPIEIRVSKTDVDELSQYLDTASAFSVPLIELGGYVLDDVFE